MRDKELLAGVRSIEHFKSVLLGKWFIIETNHHALKYLQHVTHPNSSMRRWSCFVQVFDFEVRYIAEEINSADFFKQAYRTERKVCIKIGNHGQSMDQVQNFPPSRKKIRKNQKNVEKSKKSGKIKKNKQKSKKSAKIIKWSNF